MVRSVSSSEKDHLKMDSYIFGLVVDSHEIGMDGTVASRYREINFHDSVLRYR